MGMLKFRIPVMLLTLGLFCLPAFGQEKNDVKIELTAWKIVKGSDGKESKTSADLAKPGEILEHQAVYLNASAKPVTNLLGTMPIPKGMEYLPGTASPAAVTASIDGKKYAAVPLKRRVRLANGKEDLRDVPYGEYRYLKWELRDLAAGESKKVSARMKVSTGP